MPKDKPTKLQLLYRKRFSEAVKYAHKIASDPILCATYQAKLAHGPIVVNYAISKYLRKIKEKEGPRFNHKSEACQEIPEYLPKDSRS